MGCSHSPSPSVSPGNPKHAALKIRQLICCITALAHLPWHAGQEPVPDAPKEGVNTPCWAVFWLERNFFSISSSQSAVLYQTARGALHFLTLTSISSNCPWKSSSLPPVLDLTNTWHDISQGLVGTQGWGWETYSKTVPYFNLFYVSIFFYNRKREQELWRNTVGTPRWSCKLFQEESCTDLR